MDERQYFENEYAKLVIEDGILSGSFKIQLLDLELAKKITGSRLDLQKGKKYPILSNITAVKSSTKAARDYMASEEGCQGVIAAAMIIDSVIGSMIANFFISISKPFVPTRVFTDEIEAKKWLFQYVSKE